MAPKDGNRLGEGLAIINQQNRTIEYENKYTSISTDGSNNQL